MTDILAGGTVVDVRRGIALPGHDVVLEGGRILAVRPSDGDAAPGARRVDLRGRWVVPGYLDLHTHVLNQRDPADSLALLAAHGVVGIREMSGSKALLARRARDGLRLPAFSPTVLAMPGDLLTPLNASTPELAARTVRDQHAQGADFVKVVSVAPASYLAAQAEANRLGLPMGGHLPPTLDVRTAARAGTRFVEHLGPGIALLLACSTREDEVRARLGAEPTRTGPRIRVPAPGPLVGRLARTQLMNPSLRTSPAALELQRVVVDSFDEGKARDLAALLVETGTWQSPTLIRERTSERADLDELRDDPALRFVATGTLRDWDRIRARFAARSARDRGTWARLYAARLRLVALFAEAGVRMVTGTDVSGSSWEVPGASLHREFAELAKAGLDPSTILRMATVDGAELAGAAGELGAVEAGLRAELVVLDADPLTDVRHLGAIAGVVRGGAWTDRAALDRVLADAAISRGVR